MHLVVEDEAATKRAKQRVSFEDTIQEDSSSDSDSPTVLPSTQPRQHIKPPRYNGTTLFEEFYARFENCAQYNRWSRSDKLYHLRNALIEEAGQVLFDSGPEITNSLSKLVKLLKSRYGGSAHSDKYKMELRTRTRGDDESLQSLHRDIRRMMVLAYPSMDTSAREVLAVEYFMNSLRDADLVHKLREKTPSTLDEVLKFALQLEVWAKESAQRRKEEKDKSNKEKDFKGKSTPVRGAGPQEWAALERMAHSMETMQTKFQEFMKSQNSEQNEVKVGGRQWTESKPPQAEAQPQQMPTTSTPIHTVPTRDKVQRGPIRCWGCNKTGHIMANCRVRPEQSVQQPQETLQSKPVQSTQPSYSRLSRVYLHTTLKGRPMRCLLDTGSDVILAPYEMISKYKCKLRKSAIEKLKAANGSDIVVNGETTIPLHVAGRHLDTVALISKDISEVILGIDWLRQNNCEWDFINSRVRFEQGDWIDLVSRYNGLCRRVYVSEDVLLEPRKETVIPARATLEHIRWKPPITAVEAHKLQSGIYVGRTLIPPQHDQAKVCIVNTLLKPQLLTKGTCLGNLQTANIIESAGLEEAQQDSESVVPKLMGNLPDELNAEQRASVRNLLTQYEDIFSKNEFDIGRTHLVEYNIDTGDSRPIRQPLRRQPLKHLDAIDENVEAMAKHGIIEPAASPWASNVVIVSKKDGSLRFCVDYRSVNAVTYKDSYPLPLIDNCLNAMSGAAWFSTLDLRAGYHNIPVAEKDRDKTAFITRRGCWRYTVMPFGLTCAPSVFQRLMDLVLCGLSYVSCLVYLDDIIIYSRTFEEHIIRLEEVFARLRWARLKLKVSKCSLLQRRVYFLGHLISESGVEMQTEKIEAVQKWPTPRNLHEVRSFLGLCSYYRRFIAGFADIAAPLHALGGKCVRFEWRLEHQTAFEN